MKKVAHLITVVFLICLLFWKLPNSVEAQEEELPAPTAEIVVSAPVVRAIPAADDSVEIAEDPAPTVAPAVKKAPVAKKAPAVATAPKAPAVEPAPKAPVVESAPVAPVVESAPKAPAVEPAPKAPVVESAPKAPVVESAPKAPVVESTPEAPVVTPAPEMPDDYVGRFSISGVGVDVACYGSREQSVVDASDSAAFFYDSGHLTIGDHVNQGFSGLKGCSVGEQAKFDTYQGVYDYTCVDVIQGHNTGVELTDANYNNISEMYPDALVCYTCNDNWQDVTILFFVPV